MPLIRSIPGSGTFFCPHCGVLSPLRSNVFCDAFAASQEGRRRRKCVVCKLLMDEREPAQAPIYKLIHQPEDA